MLGAEHLAANVSCCDFTWDPVINVAGGWEQGPGMSHIITFVTFKLPCHFRKQVFFLQTSDEAVCSMAYQDIFLSCRKSLNRWQYIAVCTSELVSDVLLVSV